MIMKSMTASALAGGLLMLLMHAPAQALPAAKTDGVNSSAVVLAGHRGPGAGGGGGGFKMGGGGGGGFKMGGGGSGFKMGGGGSGFKKGGGGFKFGDGGGPKFYGGGKPKVYGGGFNNFKGWKNGPKFSGDYKHGHKGHHGHKKFRNFAFYGYPYFYGYGYSSYGSCNWLYVRAIRTGSAYWWDRYYACRDGYYYDY